MISKPSRTLQNIILIQLPKLGKKLNITIGVCWLVCVAWTDYITTYEVSVSVLYLFSIFILTISTGLRGGLAMALACAIARRLTDYITGMPYNNFAHFYYNTFISFLIFSSIAYLSWELHKSYLTECTLSRTDELTNISNRRSFYELAENELLRCRRTGRPFNLLIIDADDFKVINDTFGHLIGDKALQKIAQTIKTNLRATDVVARLGGDEFAVLLPEISGDETKIVADKIHSKLFDAMQEESWPVTFSIGVVSCHSMLESLESILHKADIAMYESKRTGKNSIISDQTC